MYKYSGRYHADIYLLTFVQERATVPNSQSIIFHTIEYKMEEDKNKELRKRETIVSSTEFQKGLRLNLDLKKKIISFALLITFTSKLTWIS